jgi:hypothetical protein
MPDHHDDPVDDAPSLPRTHSWLDGDCHLGTITDRALANVAARLELDVSTLRDVRLVIGSGANSCVDRVIRIDARSPPRGFSSDDWFELLFTHELTHLLVRETWGLPAVLFWEGLAVHLGDDAVRTRLSGNSYHDHCRALDAIDALLPLESLLRASTYYRRRTDFRVDLQAGSFCGFLLDAYGPSRVGRFLTDCPRPTHDPASSIVDPIAQRRLGSDVRGLRDQWLQFLRARSPEDPTLIDRLPARPLGDTPDGPAHCDACFERAPHDHARGACSPRRPTPAT